ncbi:uncharacterized protein LOC143212941 [Lasioglossum baleicum]|uniref:uncharacterized protein LOC143212941 n=1 Tax=Lasioglossum baleicum TaxID=434251 RepID=UPI003FCC6ED9
MGTPRTAQHGSHHACYESWPVSYVFQSCYTRKKNNIKSNVKNNSEYSREGRISLSILIKPIDPRRSFVMRTNCGQFCQDNCDPGKMEVFEGNLKLYHTLTCYTGLWPYDKSILTSIQRFVFVVMSFTCIVNQMSTVRYKKLSLEDIIVLISFGCTLLLYFSRYSTSLMTFPLMKFVFDSMQKDYTVMKNNPVEVQMLMEDSIVAKRIVQSYFSMMCTGGLCLVATLGVSTLVDSDVQLHYLNLLGFFYTERSLLSAISCWHIVLTTTYRLRNAINAVAHSDTINEIDIRAAMDVHCRAMLLVTSSKYYIRTIDNYWRAFHIGFFLHVPFDIVHSLSDEAILKITVSYAVNIYRFFISITEFSDKDAVLLSIHFVVTYTTFICGNNYSGQILLDTSAALFHDTYNSLWYRIPPKMQKMVLFTMMKTQVAVELNCAGLFTPCYEGFAAMMSSSFSYFTLLCSV